MIKTFDKYLIEYDKKKMHKYLEKYYESIPDTIDKFENIILYGNNNIGKYTQSLVIIRKYSNSGLKYRKRFNVVFNKKDYFFILSDIHFEVDMSLLGCNSKMLWNEVYIKIKDIILSRQNKTGIILCKNFHEIHPDLLDAFYTYMQSDNCINCNIKFIIITEHITFLPDDIINCCKIIGIQKPNKSESVLCKKTVDIKRNKLKSDIIINMIINIENLTYSLLRENMYNILIYNLDVHDCIWNIVSELILKDYIKEESVNELLIKMYKFLEYFNNNYRPIFHLESFIIYLVNIIHGVKEGIQHNANTDSV
tara:strand:- start:25636 stop:26562 length:927 start_codon:yes stop_codon:yes gene_type:complete